MKARRRAYRPEDFVPVRDFLVHTFGDFKQCYNWRLERWNYARYFVAPMLGARGEGGRGVEGSREAIRAWEGSAAIWESDGQGIVGVGTWEYPVASHPGFGDFFPQRHPGYGQLLDEMLDYAEEMMAGKGSERVSVYVYEEDEPFQAVARRRGYEKEAGEPGYDSIFPIDGRLPEPRLPAGYAIRSMADEDDVERRREGFGRGFNHPDPADWPSAFSYRELQRAPDYRPELDLYVVAPDGAHVSCCIVWYDAHNQIACLEPMCTHPDFRRRGLGQEVVMEAVRRVAALGAEEVWVGSGQPFYEALGFQKVHPSYRWDKRLVAG